MSERDTEFQPSNDPGPVAFSNAVRLTIGEWAVVGVLMATFVFMAPSLWKRWEPFVVEADYRVPHDLSNDYWLYQRFAELVAEKYSGVIIGDSVVWGEYVTRQQTLSHYLNELAGEERFANLGLDGAHPLALSGLVEHYAASIRGKDVVLECNLLWLSLPRRDLQDDKETEFNHPRLVPQFVPRIPSYREEISPRIGVEVERRLPLGSWTTHLQQAYYDRIDIPSWTLDHPYDNPAKPMTHGLPASDNALRHLPQPWYKSGITKQDFPWVDLKSSLQWQGFQQVVRTLQSRDNRLVVLVGPFNEHLLTTQSQKRYEQVKSGVTGWLRSQGVPHFAPDPLASELYGDASHPLAAGYEELARRLSVERFFHITNK